MSDGVLAAIIAACATVFTSFLQLRASFTREVAARTNPSSTRRKSRIPMVVVAVMLGGAAVAGFALSQWMTEHERLMQDAVQKQLQARIATLTRSESQLVASRASARAEIEAGVLRQLGLEGVVVSATVAPCRPPLVISTPTLTTHTSSVSNQGEDPGSTSGSSSTCNETDANAVTLCATVPAKATVTEVELFMRPVDAEAPWSAARVMPGTDVGQARFAEAPLERAEGTETKLVCQAFASWASDRARIARMLVRYSL